MKNIEYYDSKSECKYVKLYGIESNFRKHIFITPTGLFNNADPHDFLKNKNIQNFKIIYLYEGTIICFSTDNDAILFKLIIGV